MVTNFFAFIKGCMSWLPGSFLAMISICVCIRFGDTILGVIDRAWRLIGR